MSEGDTDREAGEDATLRSTPPRPSDVTGLELPPESGRFSGASSALLSDAWRKWTRMRGGTACIGPEPESSNSVGLWEAGCVDLDALARAHASVLDQAVDVIGLVRPLVDAVTRRDRDLASQLRRALSHVALNVAEGFGAGAGNARVRYETARSALYEAQAVLRVATAWGYVSAEDAHSVLEPMQALAERVFGLSRR